MSKHWSKIEKEKFHESVKRFEQAMSDHDPNHKGQVIAINSNKRTVIKSKCRKGTKRKSA